MNIESLHREASEIAVEAIALRREIHRHPEVGRDEHRTSELVLERLDDLGICCKRIADTGVMGDLWGRHQGRCIALRADMDALPITETTGLPFASENAGVMHACGHDLHTAALLGAAELLARHRDELRGTVRFLFQPDEEQDGGADRMIAEGCMEGVDEVYGMHVAPELPTGTIGVRYGAAYASSNVFDLEILGQGAHGAQPDHGVDALLTASEIVVALQSIVSRNVSPLDSAVVTIGTFESGTARNIIADRARLKGTLRCYGAEARDALSKRIEAVANGIAFAHGAQVRFDMRRGYTGIINCDEQTQIVQACAEALFGTERVVLEQIPSLTTEDFGSFLQCAPGSYWHLGVSAPGEECSPLHTPTFNPDERALIAAIEMHTLLALTNCR